MLGWLLILVPVAVSVHWLMPEAHSLVFGIGGAGHHSAGWLDGASDGSTGGAGGRRCRRLAQRHFRECRRAGDRPLRSAPRPL